MSIQYTADQLQRKFRGAAGSPGFPRLAEVLRSEGRVDEAIQTCLEGLRARPDSLSGLLVLGKAFLDAGRVEDARDQFEAVLRLDPRCLSAMHHLARIMTRMQWPDAAAGYYRSILEVEPWDAEARGLLGGDSLGAAAPGAAATAAGLASGFIAPGAEEDTYHKPEGFAGDVMEVNLNDMAADFLPGRDDDASLGLAEESLEDALAASQEPMSHQPRFEAPAPQERKAEPLPMDVLKDEPVPAEMDGEAPPISGQDVEDRLDSLFGVEDSPSASMRDATATWSAAPAESPAPEIPPGPGFSLSDPSPAATALSDPRPSEADGTAFSVESDFAPADADTLPGPVASAPAEAAILPAETETPPEESEAASAEKPYPQDPATMSRDSGPFETAASGAAMDSDAFPTAEAPGVQDFSAVDFETPLERRAPAGPGAFADPESAGPEDRVHGEDIERRLDELFNLTEEDDRPPAAASALPVAPAPEMGEAVSLGEVVSFGGEAAFEESDAAGAAAFPAAVPAAFTSAAPTEDTVTGQDVADKLDLLFGAEAAAPSDSRPDSPFLSSAPAPAFKEATPWPGDERAPSQPSGVTGADVEAQLDKLFLLEDGGAPSGAAASGNDKVTFGSPEAGTPSFRPADSAPGDGSDLTVVMPAFRETPGRETPGMPKDADRLAQDFGAGDTIILPIEGSGSMRDFDASLEPPPEARETSLGLFQDEDAFGTLAPEDSAAPSGTASIEMVDGEDVAGRLDELFADDGAPEGAAFGKTWADAPSNAHSGGEMPLFTTESGEAPDLGGAEAMETVSGEDVSSRLQQLFEAGDASPVQETDFLPESGVATGSETDEDMVPLPGFAEPAASAAPAAPAAPRLAPMSDEEDAYPDEDDLAGQSGAGANVATVTLAEIYFQQGLREQALQIYRQLLEREPENDSARKRIEEIEATKPDGGEPGPGSDPRRPRPGLKVPKRKK